MKRVRTLRILIVALLLGALLGAGTFVVLRSPQKVRTKLADGTVLVLERAAPGKENSSYQGKFGFQKYREFVAALLSRPSFQRFTKPGSLVFWISHRESGSGAYRNLDWFSHARIVDEHGCEFESGNLRVEANGWSGSGQSLPKAPAGSKYIFASGMFETFPRRSVELRLKVYDQSNQLVAELLFPNPVKGPVQEWKPTSLPKAQTVGGTTFTLLTMTNQVQVFTRNGIQIEKPVLSSDYQVHENGVLVANWSLGETVLQDATGNQTTSSGYSLCTNESAWKLEAVFFRTPDSQFEPNEIWTLTNIAIPKSGSTSTLNRSNTIQGVLVRLCAVAGAGNVTYSNGIPVRATASNQRPGSTSMSGSSRGPIIEINAETGAPQAVVEIQGLEQDQKFDFWATDSTGNRFFLERGSSGNYRLFASESEPVTPTMDFHFVVQTKRQVAFMIRPPAYPAPDDGLSEVELEQARLRAPKRGVNIDPRCIDLTEYYTTTFTGDDWIRASGPIPNGSASRSFRRSFLPSGLQVLAGVPFDVRGAVQLGGLAVKQRGHRFPREFLGIPVGTNCRKINFLHGAIWTVAEGTAIGAFEIQYDDGESESVPIVYGRDVRDWALQRNELPEVSRGGIAWQRSGPGPDADWGNGVLYLTAWNNPRPSAKVKEIHFRSTMTSAAPFLAGLTVE